MQTPLMQYLKEATRPNHEDAESQPFQAALVNGTLPFETYCQYLIQLHALHEPIERRIAENAANPQIAAVMKPDYNQAPFIEKDLAALNVPLSSSPMLECVRKFNETPIFRTHPESCLGVVYVLLGSKHGAKFIAHKVKEAYSLSDDAGYSYFNPYGENFRPLWQQFVASMNEAPMSDESREAMLEASTLTFNVFGSIGADLWRASAQVRA